MKRLNRWSIVVIVFGVSIIVSLLALRSNNQNMARLRTELINADKSGDIGKVELAAKNLQHYVSAHMNTDTGRVALQAAYDKAAAVAMESAKPEEVDADIYAAATERCRPELNNYGYRAWASCVAGVVGTNPAATTVTSEDVVPDPDLYYVDYAAPRWSSDLAGWSLIIAICSGAMLIYKGLVLLLKYFKNKINIALKH